MYSDYERQYTHLGCLYSDNETQYTHLGCMYSDNESQYTHLGCMYSDNESQYTHLGCLYSNYTDCVLAVFVMTVSTHTSGASNLAVFRCICYGSGHLPSIIF